MRLDERVVASYDFDLAVLDAIEERLVGRFSSELLSNAERSERRTHCGKQYDRYGQTR